MKKRKRVFKNKLYLIWDWTSIYVQKWLQKVGDLLFYFLAFDLLVSEELGDSEVPIQGVKEQPQSRNIFVDLKYKIPESEKWKETSRKDIKLIVSLQVSIDSSIVVEQLADPAESILPWHCPPLRLSTTSEKFRKLCQLWQGLRSYQTQEFTEIFEDNKSAFNCHRKQRLRNKADGHEVALCTGCTIGRTY